MEYSNTITFFIVLVLIMFIFVVMVNFIIPFKLKSDFDDVSSSYHTLVQLEGGMSSQIRNELELELIKLGMSDVKINCKGIDEVRYGERFEFHVVASINVKLPNNYLKFENKTEKLEFKRVSFSKRLIN